MNCSDQNIELYLYGELPRSESESFEAHVKDCTVCQARLEAARRLHAVLAERLSQEPSPELIVRCRQALGGALDREERGWRRVFAGLFAPGALARPPLAVAALLLVFFGFGLGWALRPHAFKAPLSPGAGPEPQSASFLGGDFGHISSISQVAPDPQSDKVRITLNAEHRVTLEGPLDDPDIRRILVDAMKNYSNPGIRLDTLDALKQQSGNPAVQTALLYALRHDSNTGVRLEALRCVGEMNWSPEVEQVLLEAVKKDANPGIRVAAIDALVEHTLNQRDESMVPALQELSENDSNPYVRIKALAAVHELGKEQ